MSMLESKCQEYGLKYLETQESHTSKCSAIDNEEVKQHAKYVGKRVKRGLFKSKDGILINSDVNGAINIARKLKVTAIQFNTVEQIKGIMVFPKRIRIA
jgi:putative transposase